jgi:ankyrin repeat protein
LSFLLLAPYGAVYLDGRGAILNDKGDSLALPIPPGIPQTADGGDINARDANGATSLMRAAGKSDLDLVVTLLFAHADVLASDKDGDTALMYAGSSQCVTALVYGGANVDAIDYHGRTALMFAPTAACINALATAGANLNAQDNNGRTALMFATLHGSLPCVKALIAAGEDPNVLDKAGKTALALAKAADIIAALKAAGAT